MNGDSKLPEKAKSYIDDWENNLYFSVASLWEIEIKHIIHPDKMMNSASEILDLCRSADFTLLPLHPEHIKLLHTLQREEKAPPHNDPFDRILISQAKFEEMMFLTHDGLLKYYNEPCVMDV
ncbi:MAG: type II toxin-antitoxin system VapC family toxin [Treponema sp.]|nr:type II toxin-antitoxin system VapC family toxin [Treponema sp.]